MVIWQGLSLLPDLDVIGSRFGIAYLDPWGHRGASHSFAFAFAVAFTSLLLAKVTGHPLRTALWVLVTVVSHTCLDAMTDGGHGVAVLWPFDLTRYFAPWRPIPVSPLGRGLLSLRGLEVALLELTYSFPLMAYALWPRRRSVG